MILATLSLMRMGSVRMSLKPWGILTSLWSDIPAGTSARPTTGSMVSVLRISDLRGKLLYSTQKIIQSQTLTIH